MNYILRSHRPGDIGWIIHRHGMLSWQEYGWDERFEALVAHVAANFIENYDRARERCWIAEADGQVIGSVFCVRKTDTVAQLRMLYVEPSARGSGVGTRLVSECVQFARDVGYKSMILWTQAVLVSARRLYEAAGFRLVSEEAKEQFGRPEVSQIWQIDF